MVSPGVAHTIELCDYKLYMHCGNHGMQRKIGILHTNMKIKCPTIPYIISQPTAGSDISLAFHLLIVACGGIKKSP